MAKCPTKRELYHLTNITANFYLAPYKACNISFIGQLMRDEKIPIDRGILKTIQVPYYEGLWISDLFFFIDENPEIKKYLPDRENWDILPRDYLGNVCNTVKPKEFKELIEAKI